MKSILKIWLETAKKGETVEFKNNARRIKSPIIIYDLESILVPEKNRKQNPDDPHANKYQYHVGWSFGYKLVSADDQFTNSFKLCLDQDVVHTFTTSMIKESKYCIHVIKKPF